jgi:alkanesulfonate monooxygenase SsuD/methylene tetrahydromethanopterin reductase-like flavin-dependent oxidoreductase (luciferase family)
MQTSVRSQPDTKLVARASSREPVQPADAKSQSTVERLIVDGERYFLNWQQSDWAQQFRHRTGFAVQVFPIDTPRDPARHLLAAARLAEELGLDAFFVGDHPAWALDPFVHLAAIAASTTRIRLGVNVCCALYRHPVMTARLAADVDNLSAGRLILGLGNGWDGNEFANLGLPFPPAGKRQQALEEAITIMRGVWRTSRSPTRASTSNAPEHACHRRPSKADGCRS